MKGVALQSIAHDERAAERPRRSHDHARAHKEEVPALLAQLAVLALMVLAHLALTHVMKVWFHRRFGLG